MSGAKKITVLLTILGVMTGFTQAATHNQRQTQLYGLVEDPSRSASDLAGGQGLSPTRAKTIRLR